MWWIFGSVLVVLVLFLGVRWLWRRGVPTPTDGGGGGSNGGSDDTQYPQ